MKSGGTDADHRNGDENRSKTGSGGEQHEPEEGNPMPMASG